MEKNTQQPVAWLKYPRKKPELMQVSLSELLPVALKNSGWVSVPLYEHPPAPPVPRDVLMAALQDAANEFARNLPFPGRVDIAAISDRYASQVQPEPVVTGFEEWLHRTFAGVPLSDAEEQIARGAFKAGATATQPEPVNQQLLAALKRLLHKAYKQNWQDNYPSEVECAESAIAATEAAQQVEPIGYMRPDELQKAAVAPYLCRVQPEKDKQSDMVPVYAQQPARAQPVAVPDGWKAAMAFARAALAEAIQIAPLDRLPPMAGAAMQQIDAMLSAAQKPEGHQ